MRVLVLSRNYPNRALPLLGIWVQGLVQAMRKHCDPCVVSPVPYCPPIPSFVSYARYRQIEAQVQDDGVDVWHPRCIAGLGHTFHAWEGWLYHKSVRRLVRRLHESLPFDVIHAHFAYPDGAVAVRLGQELGIPVAITEHARWIPWMERFPSVRRQAVDASRRCSAHVHVSRFVMDTVTPFTGQTSNAQIVPVGVDASVFHRCPDQPPASLNQILFVGRIHHVKGVDVLLRAMKQLVVGRPELRLVMVGGGFIYRDYRRQEEQLRQLAEDLDLCGQVQFVGPKTPQEVAQLMRGSSVVVLPSRAETFGAVLIEALACGTPVVATRCGGPQEFITEEMGELVPVEDPVALSAAIVRVLQRRESFDAEAVSNHVLAHYSWDRIAHQMSDVYQRAINQS